MAVNDIGKYILPMPESWDDARVNTEKHNWQVVRDVLNKEVGKYISPEIMEEILSDVRLKYKEEVTTVADLPLTDEENTIRSVLENNKLYIYNGAEWVPYQTHDPNKINEVERKMEEISLDATTLGAVGDGTTDNATVLSGLAHDGRIIFSAGVYHVATDTTISPDALLWINKGAVLQPANGVTLTIDANIVDSMYQIFDLSLGGNIAGLRKNDHIRPEWFGAKGDYDLATHTGTDDSVAFQQAVDVLESEHLPKLKVSSARYYFENKVIMRKGGHVTEGPGGLSRNVFQTSFITGIDGLECLFDYGNSESTHASNHLMFVGVNFYTRSNSTGVKSAIKYTQDNNGPHRNFNAPRCGFIGFDKAVHFVCPTANNVVVANANFEGCVFHAGRYAVYSDSRVLGLRFVNNHAEQGARIHGMFESAIVIRENMLEGQTDAVSLHGGAAQIEIGGNYIEANNGEYIFKMSYTNIPKSTLIIYPNYIGGSDTVNSLSHYFDVKGIGNIRVLETGNTGNYLALSGTNGYPLRLNGGGFRKKVSVGGGAFGFLLTDYFANLKPNAEHQKVTVGASSAETFIGTKSGKVFTSNAANYYTASMGYSAGDHIVVNVLVKKTDIDEIIRPHLTVYNDAYEAAGSATLETFYKDNTNGEDMLVTFVVKAGNSGADIRLRFNGYGSSGTGSGVFISDAEVFVHRTSQSTEESIRIDPYISRG